MMKKVLYTIMTAAMIGMTASQPAGMTETFASEAYAKGDVNGDGKINLMDAQLTLKAALGITKLASEAENAADADDDGKTNLKDAQLILKAALGIIKLDNTNVPDNATDAPATEQPSDNKPTVTENPAVTGKPATEKPDNNPADKATENPKATESAGNGGTASDKPTETEKPATEQPTKPTKPETTVALTQPTQPTTLPHTHNFNIPVYTTKHHDEVGHMETVTIEAWEEPVEVTEYVQVCNTCKKTFGPTEYGSPDNALDALGIHQWEDSPNCAGYHSEKITYTYYVHHDAGTEQKYVVDTPAYDEQVITGYTCSCGATK